MTLLPGLVAFLVSAMFALALKALIFRARRLQVVQHDFGIENVVAPGSAAYTTLARTFITVKNTTGGPLGIYRGQEVRPSDVYAALRVDFRERPGAIRAPRIEGRPYIVDRKPSVMDVDVGSCDFPERRVVLTGFHLNPGDEFTFAVDVRDPFVKHGWRHLLVGPAVECTVEYGISGLRPAGPARLASVRAPLRLFSLLVLAAIYVVASGNAPAASDLPGWGILSDPLPRVLLGGSLFGLVSVDIASAFAHGLARRRLVKRRPSVVPGKTRPLAAHPSTGGALSRTFDRAVDRVLIPVMALVLAALAFAASSG